MGQANMQAPHPFHFWPLCKLGLGVQMHHLFPTKCLVGTLYQHGFPYSYSEVENRENNASVAQGTELSELSNNSFVQYSCDNVDHNLRPLDGKGLSMVWT